MKENAESAPWWRLVILDNYGSQAKNTDTEAKQSTQCAMRRSTCRGNFLFLLGEACVAIAAPLKLLVSARGLALSVGTIVLRPLFRFVVGRHGPMVTWLTAFFSFGRLLLLRHSRPSCTDMDFLCGMGRNDTVLRYLASRQHPVAGQASTCE